MKTSTWLCAAAVISAHFAINLSSNRALAAPTDASDSDITRSRYGVWGFDTSGQDPNIRPGDDFYHYANGAWVKRTAIPPDKARYDSFQILADLSQRRVRAILENAAAKSAPEPADDQGKIGAFYKSFMDEERIEALGAAPLKPDLAMIRSARSRADIAGLMGRGAERFFRAIFSFSIAPDPKNPSRYTIFLAQSGLGLPDRDYYLDSKFADKKVKYQAYVAHMLELAGWPEANARAKTIVELESRIAEASWSRAKSRDPIKTYNPMTLAELERYAPGFEWRAMLEKAGLPAGRPVIVAQKSAVPKIAAIYARTPLSTLKAWEAFNVIDTAAPYLAKRFADASFEFHNRSISGQPEQAPRWKRGVNAVQLGDDGGQLLGGMGEAIGRIYAAQFFTPEAKSQMEGLVENLKEAFQRRIERVDWMSPQTKARALEKLSRYTVKIGYPLQWRDYSSLRIRVDDIYGNIERAQAYEWRRSLDRLDSPVDRGEWVMTSQTINAYNNPLFNEVVFPAAILQPPFFDPTGDPAINYGAIGTIIGHEMTHGFDDQGRQYDAGGRLADWWTPDDGRKFEAKAKRLAAEYSAFEVLPGAHVNGDLTTGENIADLGGLNLALDAYHASLHGQPAPVIDGLTGDQRVFLGWAQVWRSKTREDEIRRLLVIDVHSPAPARVDLPMTNIDTWYEAFSVAPTDKHYVAPADRVRIW